MHGFNLHKAMRLNRYFAFAPRTNWASRFDQLITELGFYNRTPGEEEFVQAVYAFQQKTPGLKPDGILGPKTWKVLEPRTRFSVDLGAPKPDWLKKPRNPVSHQDEGTGIWLGLAVEYGGHAVALGPRTTHAFLISLERYERHLIFTREAWRIGPGLGAGIGLKFIVATSLWDPRQLKWHTDSGWDFEFSLGKRWAAFAEHVKNFDTVRKIVKRLEHLKETGRFSRYLLKLSPSEWIALSKRVKNELIPALGLKTDDLTPHLVSLSLPVDAALEVSAFWEFSNYRLELASSS